MGAGRAALAKRAKSRRGGENRVTAAARRGLARNRRGGRRTKRFQLSQWGPAAELLRFSRLFEQKFLSQQRLRYLLIALAGAWVAWTFVIGDASLTRLWFLHHENARLTAEIEDLAADETKLKAEVDALSDPSDREALELVARDEHALVRDGETLVRFYEPEDED